MPSSSAPRQDRNTIAERARHHLEQVVRVDSASDEASATIPSTPGQARLATELRGFFEAHGATTGLDPHANLVATLPGRGEGRDKAPIALMVHLDTARGTHAVDALHVVPRWDGSPLPYPANPSLVVDVETYPSLARYVGHDVLHGPGDAPFGLDDKLGLAHLMTLAWLLATNPDLPHPPLLLIGRPDEEIGRMEALLGVAELLDARGVRSGYTIDGLDPFEINIENFNARRGGVFFPASPLDRSGEFVTAHLGGVNTHGATARAEGHRTALRLAAEVVAMGLEGVRPVYFASDAERDCDAVVSFGVATPEARRALIDALASVVAPHRKRGASLRLELFALPPAADANVEAMLRFVHDFLRSDPGFTLAAEDSDGHDGYSHPYRALPTADGLRLDVRIRDFSPSGLDARSEHLRRLATERGLQSELVHQYVNMGPRLADRPELVDRARAAAAAIGVESPVQPIRGGTGVDPFLDRGIAIANLGTGYFAPESEKELTSLQLMADHALWLLSLVQQIAAE